MGDYQLFHGDCLEILPTLEAGSVDAVITDPPYGLGFMGKDWDHGVPGERFWAEVLRVAKPGAFLLAFGGTRTFHRLAVAIEDAGWEIRDCVMWVYGSGFPKSHDVSKAIDKAGGNRAGFAEFRDAVKDAMKRNNVSRKSLGSALGNYMLSHYLTAGSQPAVPNYRDYVIIRDHVGLGDTFDGLFAPEAEREVVGRDGRSANESWLGTAKRGETGFGIGEWDITVPATDAARQWDGWGTALKPAWEPVIVAMKPTEGTFAENALKHGVAGLNIDGSRVEVSEDDPVNNATFHANGRRAVYGNFALDDTGSKVSMKPKGGRWPANVIHDGSDEVVGLFPKTGPSKSGGKGGWQDQYVSGTTYSPIERTGYDEPAGSAARFFYCAKASRAERDAGLEGEGKKQPTLSGGNGIEMVGPHDVHPKKNHHPTVKPIELMRYLCKLTATPTGGVVLDPFMGSGSTGVAALREGRDFVGIEMDAEYLEIARRRIEHAAQMAAGQFVDKRGKAGDTEDLPLFGAAN